MTAQHRFVFPDDLVAVAARYDGGEVITTVQIGGLGPGYELTIQTLAWEFIAHANELEKPAILLDAFNHFSDSFEARYGYCLGLSGAQHGGAYHLVDMFTRYGYAAALDKLPRGEADRRILHSNHWHRRASQLS